MRILKETLQDVVDYLQSSELKDDLVNRFPEVKKDPSSVEYGVNDFIIESVIERFPDEPIPDLAEVVVIKALGSNTEVVSTDHEVIKFNGTYYDYTAHQFSDAYSNLLSFNNVPVTQKVITNDRQINSGVSSVKSYALLERGEALL